MSLRPAILPMIGLWLAGLLVAGPPAHGQWGDGVIRLSESLIGGPFHDVEVQSTRAYCAMGYGLAIFDFSTPSQLQMVGLYGLPGSNEGVFISGNYAYVASGAAGLQILDVSNPASPEFVSELFSPGYGYELVGGGGFLYFADGAGGLRVINISDPAHPLQVAALALGGWARDLYLDGSYLYVAAETAGLKIVNVAVPAQPQIVGTYNTAGQALGVCKSGNYAYVADGPNGLLTFDVTDPAQPEFLGQWTTTGLAHEVDVSGIYAYVSDDAPGLVILNVNNPALPFLVGQYNSPGLAWSAAISGTTLLLADDSQGLSSLTIANPQAPALLDAVSNPGEVRSVWVIGDFAYAARGFTGEVAILDVAAPQQPLVIIEFSPALRATEVVDALVLDTICYSSHLADGVYFTDVRNVLAPASLGRKNTVGETVNMMPRFPYLYIADEWEGLVIVSLTSLDSAWHIVTSGWAKAVFLLNDTAIVSQWDAGIALIDISNPQAPQLLDEYPTPGLAHRSDVSRGYIYVADDNAGLTILSLATGAIIGRYDTPGSAWDVQVEGDSAYVADAEGGLIILDVSDPAQPQYAASYRTPGSAQRLIVDRGTIYVADEYSLGIYRFGETGISPGPQIILPEQAELWAFPNPFNNATRVMIQVPSARTAAISLYNALGQRVELIYQGGLQPGLHNFIWDAQRASSGVYFVRMDSPDAAISSRLILQK
jgi:hypothetical protein